MPDQKKLRDTLTARASVANSPFLAEQKAFYNPNQDWKSPSRILTIVEDEYLPTRKQVATTKYFAFSALAIGNIVRRGKASTPSTMPSELQGFPSKLVRRESPKQTHEDQESDQVAGYDRLIRYATSLLSGIRSDLFSAMAAQIASSRNSVKGGALIRLRPLTPNDHVALGRLLESGNLDIAVGMDMSQPDVGEQNLFGEVSHLPEIRGQMHAGFRCMSDQQITALLAAHERTGLFWRYGGRAPAGSAYMVGSCYAQLGDKRHFSPVRLDVVARTKELQDQTSNFVSYLTNTPLITPASDLLRDLDLQGVLGSDNVAVPEFAEKLLQDISRRRKSLDSEFHRFYSNQEARLS